MPTNFLLLHGYGGKHPEHWQTHLVNSLEKIGRNVKYPDFPGPDRPDLKKWMGHLDKTFEHFNPADIVVAAHSLGCALWLHYASVRPLIKPKKCFLVSPPLNDCGIQEITSFFPLPDMDLSAQDYMAIGSDNDYFIPEKDFREISEKFNIPLKIIPEAGHINAPTYGYWEWMFNECLNFI